MTVCRARRGQVSTKHGVCLPCGLTAHQTPLPRCICKCCMCVEQQHPTLERLITSAVLVQVTPQHGTLTVTSRSLPCVSPLCVPSIPFWEITISALQGWTAWSCKLRHLRCKGSREWRTWPTSFQACRHCCSIRTARYTMPCPAPPCPALPRPAPPHPALPSELQLCISGPEPSCPYLKHKEALGCEHELCIFAMQTLPSGT